MKQVLVQCFGMVGYLPPKTHAVPGIAFSCRRTIASSTWRHTGTETYARIDSDSECTTMNGRSVKDITGAQFRTCARIRPRLFPVYGQRHLSLLKRISHLKMCQNLCTRNQRSGGPETTSWSSKTWDIHNRRERLQASQYSLCQDPVQYAPLFKVWPQSPPRCGAIVESVKEVQKEALHLS